MGSQKCENNPIEISLLKADSRPLVRGRGLKQMALRDDRQSGKVARLYGGVD